MVDLPAGLYHAVDNDNSTELQRLIELGADVDQFYDDLSHANSKALLHFACARGRTDCVKVLLENGASVNVRDKWRMTPIMYCMSTQHIEIAKLLIENDPGTINSQDTNGKSALHIAVGYGSEKTIRLLLRMGAEINLQNFYGSTPLMTLMLAKDIDNYLCLMKILIESGADINLHDFRDKRTALHLAVITKKVDAVELLLKQNANVNHLDISGKTPLINLLGYHIPVYKQTTDIKDDVMTIAVLLTQAGTDMNMTKCKAEYCNPLMMATHVKCYQLARLFLENGADVNVTFPYTNVTPLLEAVKQNDITTVRLLMDWSCRLDIVGSCRIHGENHNDLEYYELDPFEVAINKGLWDIVQLFVVNGYNVSKIPYLRSPDLDNDIPIILRNNTEMLHFLRKSGSCPQSLMKSCALVIFQSIKTNVSNRIDLLPLPVSIKRHLKSYNVNS